MSIKILSASAGSGKTFNISMFYIDRVLQNPENFKKILALTFTNAAVNEMKNRILEKLYELSVGNKKVIDEYKNYIKTKNDVQQLNDDNIIIKNADIALKTIIYNYHYFSVFTIDSFLQKIFVNCLVELDLRKNYKLIVETDNVIEEVIDEFLNIYNVEKDVLNWIKEFVLNIIFSLKKVNLKNEFLQLAQELNKEFYFFHKDKIENKDLKIYNEIVQNLNIKQKNFIDKINNISKDFRSFCSNNGFNYNDFKGGEKGIGNIIFNKFHNFKKLSKIEEIKTKTLINFLDSGEWFSKSITISSDKLQYLELLYNNITQLFTTEAEKYETARIIEDNIYNIGLIHKVIQLLTLHKNENSILFLSDIAQKIKDFVSENYLFIYEKFGIKYNYILIDEFQDTSKLQYYVIKPLIEESLSSKENETNVLIVGDVKQAIYRWRNGDWELMSKKLQEDFFKLNKYSLEVNWRSHPNIVNFNNLLIKQLIENENYKNIVGNNYDDYFQKYSQNNLSNKFHGYVKVILDEINKENEQDALEVEENWLIHEVKQLVNNNYRNIGILVRSNIEARKVFSLLTQSNSLSDIQLLITSKESITYSNSLFIELIMYLVDHIYSESSISNYIITEIIKKLYKKEDDKCQLFKNYLLNKFKVKQPLSLFLTVELIINETLAFVEIDDNEKIFAYNFLQMLNSYLAKNDNNEIAFIDWYFKEGKNKTIVLTSKSEGIFIETIHNSKGLEYEAVLIPYVNWPKRNISEYLWIENNEDDNLPVVLLNSTKALLETAFTNEYKKNKDKNKIDDLNILYVALTRAKKALIFKVYNTGIGSEIINVLNSPIFLNKELEIDGKKEKIEKFKKENIIEIGELQNQQIDIKQNEKEVLVWNKTNLFDLSLIINSNDELNTNKNIAYGNLIHKILEHITKIDSWQSAAEKVFYEYNVTEEDAKIIKNKLELILDTGTELYSWYKNSVEVLSEQIIISFNRKYRPDKIFILKDSVVIVDFKTGETDLEKYHYQIKKYSNILFQMGYTNVNAYLCNIDKNILEKIML